MPWKVPDTLSLLFWLPVAPCPGEHMHMFVYLWDAGEAGSPSGNKFHPFYCARYHRVGWEAGPGTDSRSFMSTQYRHVGPGRKPGPNTLANTAETSLLGAMGCCPLLLETLSSLGPQWGVSLPPSIFLFPTHLNTHTHACTPRQPH